MAGRNGDKLINKSQIEKAIRDHMEERAQSAVEYLMMLAAVLIVVGGILYSLTNTSQALENTAQTQIEAIKENVIDALTSIAGA